MLKFGEDWRERAFRCAACGWHGEGAGLETGFLRVRHFELLCPHCHEVVEVVRTPTAADARAHWDELSERERRLVERIEERDEEFRRRMLADPGQLPDIPDASFTLAWDYQEDAKGFDDRTVIRLGSRVIFSEPARYECGGRFVEVAEILIRKYGPRLLDLVPTRASEPYLYGDEFAAMAALEDARRRLFRRG